jgi:hypothetical protein
VLKLIAGQNQPRHGDAEHASKAEHDKCLAEMLLANGKFPDWVITSSFYLALHCVDAYAHRLGIRDFMPAKEEKLSVHGKRERFVKANLNNHFIKYKWLHDRSNQARYDPLYFKLMPIGTATASLADAKQFLGIL